MIDRKAAMGLLGALPDAMLLKALAVAGQSQPDPASGDMFGGLEMDDNNHIEPWSARQVSYEGGKDRPALIDKMWAKPGLMNAQDPVSGGTMEGEPDINYLQTGGV